MAIWKITCPDCDYCEEVRIDIDDFPEKEQKEFLNKTINNLFSLNELHKDWEADFENWRTNTVNLTQFEEKIINELTSDILPRHMPIHDWNLPYAEAIILVLRRLLISNENTLQEDFRKQFYPGIETHIHKVCWKCGKRFNSSKETFEHIEKEHITKK